MIKFFLIALVAVCSTVFLTGCGDDDNPVGPGSGNLQGTWDGQMSVGTIGSSQGDFQQQNNIRLELVQRGNSFEGLLIDFDTFAFSDPNLSADTLLVTNGLIQDGAVSFRASAAGQSSETFFEGNLGASQLSGTVVGTGFSGIWNVSYSGN